MTVGTAQDYIAQLDQRLGLPYSETLDGGVGPDYYDCSGLTMVCLDAIGINYTRTTYSQWDDQRYQHFGPFAYGDALPPLEVGDVLYMHVDGEADPGHVGTYDGSGMYIDAPHTGAFVRIETISNTPSEHVYGIIRPPFGSPVPPKPPTPSTKEMTQMGITVAQNGDIISNWVGNAGTSAAGHAFVVTQKSGTQGQPPTAQNTSIIDITSTWAFFQVQEG